VEISLMIEGQMGLTWPRWQRIVTTVERAGFAGLFRSDHFTNPAGPNEDALELIASLTWLAANTERIHFGPLVAPVSFRDPVMLTRQIAALSDLSDGRAILGLGAGWQEREHASFGYDLLDVPARIDRLGEGLDVAARLLRSDDPQSFDGRFFTLRDAVLLPRPAQHVPILVGCNGPKRTMRLAARYADIWNGGAAGPDAYREKSEHLDDLVRQEGRKPGEVKRTMMTGVYFGRSEAELEGRVERFRRRPDLADRSPAEIVALLRDAGPIVGGPDEVRAQLAAYADAGVEEIMLQWLDLDDTDGIEAFAAVAL
jgi:F420-dependent oxidoreductase-like protein